MTISEFRNYTERKRFRSFRAIPHKTQHALAKCGKIRV